MATRIFVLRFLALSTLAVWVGGFTFYSAVVIPELHEVIGSVAAGDVTRRVTVALNAIGASAVAAWWVLAVAEARRETPSPWRRARLVCLVATSALLVFLVVLHRVMDRRLDLEGLRGFYPLHRAYLIASTAQWVVNLGLLAVSAGAWRIPKGKGVSEGVDSPSG